MSQYDELKRAASEAKNWGGEVGEGRWYTAECFKRPYFSIPDAEFIAACEPGAVLALIAENDRLREDPGMRAIRSLRGDCADLMAERDQLRAEVAGLRTGYEAYEQVNAELKAENEALVSAVNEILRVTPMGVEAFGIAALVLGELSGAALGQGEQS